jgi:hypothetical protein
MNRETIFFPRDLGVDCELEASNDSKIPVSAAVKSELLSGSLDADLINIASIAARFSSVKIRFLLAISEKLSFIIQ